MPFIDSPETDAFFNALLTTPQNLFLRACAGSGKTTTIVEACKRVPQPARVIFLAFNKNIADELATRMPYYAQASTFHSYCLSALRRVGWATGKPDARKCAKLLKELVPSWKERSEWEDDALTLVSRAKSAGWGYLFPADSVCAIDELREIADKFTLSLTDRQLSLVEDVLARSSREHTVLDFDDMLLFALDPSVRFDHCNFLFVDEAQDTNGVQRALLRKMVGSGARLVAVGDPSQSIYGFRGADADACGALMRDFAMTELPLSVTWRCSKAVTAEARKFELGSVSPHAVLLQTPIDPDESTDPMDFFPEQEH